VNPPLQGQGDATPPDPSGKQAVAPVGSAIWHVVSFSIVAHDEGTSASH
jgi:hypothetical protein